MTPETRKCQNCKQNFVIEPEDFNFYERIKVPPPTFCPQCRFQRRLAFFNLINLWKRKCDLCGKESLSAYPPDAPFKVYCPPCWWSDKWDPFEYGRDYDFTRPFFDQWNELFREVPHLGLLVEHNVFETSPYTNYAGSLKNCYLLFNAEFDENCETGYYLFRNNFLFDVSLAMQCEHCYDSMHVYKVNRGIGLRVQVAESLDCTFLRNCINCQNCFGSANLRNKKYYLFNKPYDKESYFAEIKEYDLGSYAGYEAAKKEAEENWDSLPHKAINEEMNTGSSGNLFFQTKNCKDCFELEFGEDCRYLQMVMNAKDSYDVTGWAGVEKCYDSFCIGRGAFNVKFSFLAALPANDMEYSALVIEGKGFFGCASVKNGEYCILNKRYPKEEFYRLREKIVAHMDEVPYTDSRGRAYRYGEFFPVEMSPWAYNQTLADSFFPVDKKEAEERGYRWAPASESAHAATRRASDLPDHIRDVGDDVLNEIIECSRCKKGYKVTPGELSFLRKMNLPLPRRCPFCRIKEKLGVWFSEYRLVPRRCDRCGKDITTSKSLENKKQVFCRECFIQGLV